MCLALSSHSLQPPGVGTLILILKRKTHTGRGLVTCPGSHSQERPFHSNSPAQEHDRPLPALSGDLELMANLSGPLFPSVNQDFEFLLAQ